MTRTHITALFSLLALTAVLSIGCSRNPVFPILYAQTLPVTLHANWNANPPADNVVKYQLAVDAAPLLDVVGIVTPFSVSTLGTHTVKVRACNLVVSVDPTSIQCGSYSSTFAFTVSPSPAIPTGLTVTQ
jgi:hypothetical protein